MRQRAVIRAMKRASLPIIFVVLLLDISLLALGQAAGGESRIAELEATWSSMLGSRDLDGIMALMAEDSVLIIPETAPIAGLEDIRRATQTMLEAEDQVSWKSDFSRVSPSGDMAYDYGTATTKLADGSNVEGYYLVVWVKEDGEWKVAADMFN